MSKRILILLLIVSLVVFTFCTKKTTTPEEKLLPPTNLTISLVENNKIQLNWVDNSTNETKCIIDRKKGIENWYENYYEVAANITTFNDIIHTNSDTIYSYRIKAFDGEDYSEYSIPVGWFADITAPTNLQIEQIAQDSIKITWQDNSIGELNFRIDRKIGDADWQQNHKIIEPDTTIYIDYNPSLYDICNYRIFAASGNSHSQYSQNYFLPPPSNLQITLVGDNQVKLTWVDNSNYETKFIIDRKEGEFDWLENYGEVDANITTFTDNIPTNSYTVYSYKVRAFDGNDYSGCSIPAGWFAECTTPTNIIFCYNYNIEYHIVILWKDNCFGEEGYKIDRKIGAENWQIIYTTSEPNITSYIDYNPYLSNTCYYRVYAFSGSSNSEHLNRSIIVVLLPPGIDTLWTVPNTIKWNVAVTDDSVYANGYYIYGAFSDNYYGKYDRIGQNYSKNDTTFSVDNASHEYVWFKVSSYVVVKPDTLEGYFSEIIGRPY
jgi:hypothetical protein